MAQAWQSATLDFSRRRLLISPTPTLKANSQANNLQGLKQAVRENQETVHPSRVCVCLSQVRTDTKSTTQAPGSGSNTNIAKTQQDVVSPISVTTRENGPKGDYGCFFRLATPVSIH
jgi:hypothetical protein